MIPATLLPADLQSKAFIAGGYAACPALAADMDVWVPVSAHRMSTERARILTWLEDTMWPYETLTDRRFVVLDNSDAHYPIAAGKVAIVRSVHMSHPVHIMVVSHKVKELLESFDVSTHQIALAYGNVVKGSGWTPITVPPVKLKDTPTTDARMEKIAARYGHTLTQEVR